MNIVKKFKLNTTFHLLTFIKIAMFSQSKIDPLDICIPVSRCQVDVQYIVEFKKYYVNEIVQM